MPSRRRDFPALLATPCNTMRRNGLSGVWGGGGKAPTDSGIRIAMRIDLAGASHGGRTARARPLTRRRAAAVINFQNKKYAPFLVLPQNDGPSFHPISDRLDAGQCRSTSPPDHKRLADNRVASCPWQPILPPTPSPDLRAFPQIPARRPAHEFSLSRPIRLLRRASRDIPGCH